MRLKADWQIARWRGQRPQGQERGASPRWIGGQVEAQDWLGAEQEVDC